MYKEVVHPFRASLIAAAALLAVASPAAAKQAKFRASLTGTYTQQGTVTDTGCFSSDANDNITYFTKTGTASENDTFRSLKPITLTVEKLNGDRFFGAGSFSNLRTEFTVNRTSDLAGTDTPPGCRPNDSLGAGPPDCGTKKRTLPVAFYGRADHAGFSYLFRRHFTAYYPDDPFQNCSLADGVWPGKLQQSGTGKVKQAKLFRRSARTIVVHGGDSASRHRTEGQVTTDSSYRLSWTLTLHRR